MTADLSRVPDLAALRLLVDAARLGSIGAAARASGVSQQSASERLRGVEAQTGLRLLRRGSRGSEPTDEGRVVVEWAGRLLDLAEEIDHAIGGLRSDRDRDLAVWSSMTIAESLLPRWLVQLRQRQEAEARRPTVVSLTATNSSRVVGAVRSGEAHLGFVEGLSAPPGLPSVPVAADELVLVTVAGSALARRRTPLSPDDVAGLRTTGREAGSGTREVVEAALATHGLQPAAGQVELTTAAAVREAVAAGGAPAFLSRRVARRELDAGQLVEVAVEGLDLRRTFRAVWTGPARPPAGPVRELVAVARARSRAQVAPGAAGSAP
ncbi:LysR family transcriptional regulator [Nocardioides sp. AX2bis]|uniref:LysR family transcriptional regulator n=1 Tax=Nocardioides sp. AX2bis TaxID=2653157 RepID=UPI001F16E482|nr:LysR family transcriptional regulator [Nocardioides sp. AX2bis]